MTSDKPYSDGLVEALANRWLNGWRIAGWGALLSLLLIPLVAMQFSAEVQWDAFDFLFAGIMLSVVGFGIELAVRVGRNAPQRLGILSATAAGFLTMWLTGAVGMIGSEDETLNFGFVLLVLAIALGSVLVWFRPSIMRWFMGIAAIAQYAFGIGAVITMPGHAVEWGLLTFFAAAWGFSASCFHRASGNATDKDEGL